MRIFEAILKVPKSYYEKHLWRPANRAQKKAPPKPAGLDFMALASRAPFTLFSDPAPWTSQLAAVLAIVIAFPLLSKRGKRSLHRIAFALLCPALSRRFLACSYFCSRFCNFAPQPFFFL